jgi:hypothetical protein
VTRARHPTDREISALRKLTYLFIAAALCVTTTAQVTVKHRQGSLHGFLILHTLDGEVLATGDLIQTVRDQRVTAHLLFDFKDGSRYDETVVYTQSRVFQLVSHRQVLKGPKFPEPMDLVADVAKGHVTVHYSKDGKDENKTDHIDMPADLADGILTTVLQNVSTQDRETRLSMIVATPKPRLVKLVVTPQNEDTFSFGGVTRKANHFRVKIDLGGIAGAVAPLVGKEPPDIHVWILAGEAPTFLRWQGPMYANGPSWVIELASPSWKQK